MRKTLFSKYIIAFMVTVILVFVFFSTVIGILVSNYTAEEEKELLNKTGLAVSEYINENYNKGVTTDFSLYIYINKEKDIKTKLQAVSLIADDVAVFITDSYGTILVTNSEEYDSFIGSVVSVELVDEMASSLRGVEGTGRLDFISSEVFYSALPVLQRNEIFVGSVFAVSENVGNKSIVFTMIKLIAIAVIWGTIIAFIAVYTISRKSMFPLKDMSKAAKSFAVGKFDVRVPVRGDDEIAELAQAFNNMATSLESLEVSRSDFIANVSHDLRTPMTTISGFIDGILEGAIPPEKEKHYLEIISAEVKRLSRLVTLLLEITKIKDGQRQLNITSFNICEMARQVLISLEKQIDSKKLEIEFITDADSVYVDADSDAIYQVVYNLVQNATKFTDEGGMIRVRILEKAEKVYFSVYNEGVGIAENDIPYVFDRFYKTDKTRGLDKTGSGLGLYIVKAIVDSHNEEIWVKSVYTKYCEFVFTLNKSENK